MKTVHEHLASVDRQLHIARACQVFKDTEPWKVIQTALKAEERYYTEALLSDGECITANVARLQAAIRTFRWMGSLMDMKTARLAELETKHKMLADRIKRMPTIPDETEKAVYALSAEFKSELEGKQHG